MKKKNVRFGVNVRKLIRPKESNRRQFSHLPMRSFERSPPTSLSVQYNLKLKVIRNAHQMHQTNELVEITLWTLTWIA